MCLDLFYFIKLLYRFLKCIGSVGSLKSPRASNPQANYCTKSFHLCDMRMCEEWAGDDRKLLTCYMLSHILPRPFASCHSPTVSPLVLSYRQLSCKLKTYKKKKPQLRVKGWSIWRCTGTHSKAEVCTELNCLFDRMLSTSAGDVGKDIKH